MIFFSIFKRLSQFQHLLSNIVMKFLCIGQSFNSSGFKYHDSYFALHAKKVNTLTSAKPTTAAISLQTSSSEHYSNEMIFLISRGKNRDYGRADGIHYSSTYFKALHWLSLPRNWLCVSILSLMSPAEHGSQRITSAIAAMSNPGCKGD